MVATAPPTPAFSTPSFVLDGYSLLIGGQVGRWGDANQSPRLMLLSLGNYTCVSLPAPASSGSLWFGAGRFNGSQWLISGWGADDSGNRPYLYIYTVNNSTGKSAGSFFSDPTWMSGDVFGISYNGTAWLLSGMGAGKDVTPSSFLSHNRMTLGIFNESTGFKDLTDLIPHQQVGILYTNAWNGKFWMVGGGYLPHTIHPGFGVLFIYDGHTVTDLTQQITNAVPTFSSVQRIAWNSRDELWMITGQGFIATYDGVHFTDLTSELERTLSIPIQSVNVVRWNGTAWMLAGGASKGVVSVSYAWVAVYKDNRFIDLTPLLPVEVRLSKYASILTVGSASNGLWAIGGYSKNEDLVFLYTDKLGFVNLSPLIQATYVTWIRIVAQ